MNLQVYNCNFHKLVFDTDAPSTIYALSKLYMSYIFNDRFNVINNNLEWNFLSRNENIDSIRSIKYLSFEECCRNRTDEIIDIANVLNKDIYVSLSGGVDSTCVLCSFLLNDRLNIKRFHVLYNTYSIQEYPLLFEILKKNNIHCIDTKCDFVLHDMIPSDNIVVNGMCGDQLDGSNLTTSRYVHIPQYINWKDALTKYNMGFEKYKNCDEHISTIETYARYIGVELKSFNQFAWLINFGCKWTYVSEAMSLFSNNPTRRIAFFDTPYFSRWVLNRYDEMTARTQGDGWTYKTAWKKIILQYTKDTNYFLYKGKDALYYKNEHINDGISIKDDTGYHRYDYISNENLLFVLSNYIKDEFIEFAVINDLKI